MKQNRLWKSLKFRDGKIASDYDQSEWTVGKWRKNPYPVAKECEGLNCCQHIGDAMGYVRCEVLAEVMIRGKTIIGDDKITAQEMKILQAWKWTKMDSVAMAIYAAELVIGYYEEKYPNDKRPREAIEAAKAYLANPTEENAAYAAASAASAYASATHATYAAAYASATYAASAYASAASAAYASATYAASAASAASAYSYAASAYSYAAYSYAAASAYAYSYASKGDTEKAREEMKTKIDEWIIEHLKECEEMRP